MAKAILRRLTELRVIFEKKWQSTPGICPSDRNPGHCLDRLLAVSMTEHDETLLIHTFQVIVPI
ncbi:MAG: hypothetical protein ACYCUV_06290 [Phycisphaerae bacterium]